MTSGTISSSNPEADARDAERQRDEGADGVELAMAHVDDVEQAEDDGQAEGDQHHGHAERQPVDDLGRKYELQIIGNVHPSPP